MRMNPNLPRTHAGIVLPPADTKRWSPSRKAAVIAAARAGVITREEACARYMMSAEELMGWELAFDQNGIPGLRTTRLQAYRNTRIGVAAGPSGAQVDQDSVRAR